MTVLAADAGAEALRRDALVRIYEEAFPAAERQPWDLLAASVADGRRLLWVAEDEELVGFAVVVVLDGRTALLEYLAVAAGRRSCGHGEALLAEVRRALHATGVDAVYLEVEPPDDELAGIRSRRLAWYRRLGAEDVLPGQDYWMPDLTGGPPLPMVLLRYGRSGSSRPDDAETRRVVRLIHQRAYGLGADEGTAP